MFIQQFDMTEKKCHVQDVVRQIKASKRPPKIEIPLFIAIELQMSNKFAIKALFILRWMCFFSLLFGWIKSCIKHLTWESSDKITRQKYSMWNTISGNFGSFSIVILQNCVVLMTWRFKRPKRPEKEGGREWEREWERAHTAPSKRWKQKQIWL